MVRDGAIAPPHHEGDHSCWDAHAKKKARIERAFDPDILGELIGSETTAALHRTVRELPERYRDVVILCDLEERSYEDVARLIGHPVGTVRSRLHRARGLLSAKLKRLNTPSEVFSR